MKVDWDDIMDKIYVIDYLHENDFRKKERAVKKYNMLAYKKLMFQYYPEFRNGNFSGVRVFENKDEGITKYELKLPTDTMFSRIHGDMVLHYTVYENQKIVMLDTINPDDILIDGHQNELTSYKGVPISKRHAEKDMFKINLLNMISDGGNARYSSIRSNNNYFRCRRNNDLKKNVIRKIVLDNMTITITIDYNR